METNRALKMQESSLNGLENFCINISSMQLLITLLENVFPTNFYVHLGEKMEGKGKNRILSK